MLFMEVVPFLALAAGSGFLWWKGVRTRKTWMIVLGVIGSAICALVMFSVMLLMMAFSSEVHR